MKIIDGVIISMNTLKYSPMQKEVVYVDRQSKFFAYTKESFKYELNDEKAICHGISFKTIAVAIQEAINFAIIYLEQGYLIEDCYRIMLCFMCGTISSVYRVNCREVIPFIERKDYVGALVWYKDKISQLDMYDKKLLEYINKIEETQDYYINNTDNTFAKEMIYVYIVEQGNEIIDILNNCIHNLKAGYKSSNSSLKDAFDCSGYSFINGILIMTDEDDRIAISNLVHLTYARRSALYVWTGYYNGRPFIYSSEEELIAKAKDVQEYKIPVICKDYYYEENIKFNI